jgi:hypothetical protein
MLDGALNVGKGVKLEKLSCLRQLSSLSVEENLESAQFLPQLLIIASACLRIIRMHRKYCKVDVEVKLEFLADDISLPQ